jgi:hypothetical protein
VLRSRDRAGVPGLALREDPVRWPRARAATETIPPGADWRAVLAALGYELERRPRRGWLARHRGRPVAVVHLDVLLADFTLDAVPPGYRRRLAELYDSGSPGRLACSAGEGGSLAGGRCGRRPRPAGRPRSGPRRRPGG